jgi:hypothetical protein
LRLPIPPQRRLVTVYVENIIETKRIVKKNVRNRRRGSEPLLNNNVLFHGDRCDGAAVDRLLTVAGVAGIGIDDPGLVVSELEHLGAEFAAEPTSNT